MVKHILKSGHDLYLDGYLKMQLDSLVYNSRNDWDFVIIITGDRMVRTGKSVLGMQIAAYMADRLNTSFSLNNVFFDSQEMINAAQKMPKNSTIIYDEGREGLAASKTGQKLQKDLLDYFAECGQLNHIFVIVLPDFFELKENMAVARSEILLNVYRKAVTKMKDIYGEGQKIPVVEFTRGYFEFFSRDKKAALYDKSKSLHRKNYHLEKANFLGNYTNKYVLDEAEYREKKRKALERFEERKKKEETASKTDIFRNKIIIEKAAKGLNQREIAESLEREYGYPITPQHVGRIINKQKLGEAA